MTDYDDYEDVELDNFNILDLKEIEKKKEVQNIVLINQQIKYLHQQKMHSLSKLAEEGASEKMFQAVLKAHRGILDSEIEMHLLDILNDSFEDKDELLFLLENKNKPFYKSSDVFDEHSKHKVQKALVKDKLLSKRSIKKQKTACQHITHVKQAKDHLDEAIKDKINREISESRLQKAEAEILQLKLDQLRILGKLNEVEDIVGKIPDALVGIDDTRKVIAYLLKNNEKFSSEHIAKILNVTRQTVNRWLKEIGN